MGNLAEGLILKGSRRMLPGFQQSYPQKIWMPFKVLKNQALSDNFEKVDKS
jgi:hypothetical protein